MVRVIVQEQLGDIQHNVLGVIQMRRFVKHWNHTYGEALGLGVTMRLEADANGMRAFVEFETEEEAVLFKLTYL